jgi:hypothetical protein
MYPQYIRYFLIISIITDIALIAYLITLIDEIGFFFFFLLVILLLSGTYLLYIVYKRNNRNP